MINMQTITVIIIISTSGFVAYVANMCCRSLLNDDDPETITNRINEINSLYETNSETDSV